MCTSEYLQMRKFDLQKYKSDLKSMTTRPIVTIQPTKCVHPIYNWWPSDLQICTSDLQKCKSDLYNSMTIWPYKCVHPTYKCVYPTYNRWPPDLQIVTIRPTKCVNPTYNRWPSDLQMRISFNRWPSDLQLMTIRPTNVYIWHTNECFRPTNV